MISIRGVKFVQLHGLGEGHWAGLQPTPQTNPLCHIQRWVQLMCLTQSEPQSRAGACCAHC